MKRYLTGNRLPVGVWLFLCGVYLLTLSGHTYSADEETMYAVTRALVETGDVVLRAAPDAPIAALRPGRDGLAFSPYGILPSLLAVPPYLIGTLLAAILGGDALLHDYLTRLLISLLNGPITAATAALLAGWALRLGVARGWALGIALAYGLAGFAWPYARTFFSEPLAALLIMLAAERADAAIRSAEFGPRPWFAGERGALLIGGLAAGLLLTARLAAGVALLPIGLYLLWAYRQRLRTQPIGTLLTLAHLPLGMLPGLLLLSWYNLARFATAFASGYASESGLFTTPLATGLLGLLLSPGKGVIWYAPLLLAALPGSLIFWRRGKQALVLFVWGLFLSHLLLYARWGEWQGGGVWGPRFLLPVLAAPLLMVGGLAWLPGRRVARNAVGLLVLLGFAGNLGGVLLNFNTYVVLPSDADRLYSLRGSPLIAHWRILSDRWRTALALPPYCAVGDGWYPSEDAQGGVLPRRSGANAQIECRGVSRVGFSLDDRRPPEAPPSDLQLSLNGRRLGPLPAGQLRTYELLLPQSARLRIQVQPWNPAAVGFSPRADDLGPAIDTFALDQDAVLLNRAIAPLPSQPRPRWAWYFDPPNQHLADLWFWYLPRSEIAGPLAWVTAILIILGGGILIGLGLHVLRSAFSPQPSALDVTPAQMPT